MDISYKTDEERFNYRVAGIIICDNKLLVMKGFELLPKKCIKM